MKKTTGEERLWALIRGAGALSPHFRVKVEVGDIPAATCMKPVRSMGYLVSGWRNFKGKDGGKPYDEIVEGEWMPVRLHGLDEHDWIGHMEDFVREMGSPGGKVLHFYVSTGGVGNYGLIRAGVCAYEAA